MEENKVFKDITAVYEKADNKWRKIDDNWLISTGLLVLRLNSHINNTSHTVAIEFHISGEKNSGKCGFLIETTHYSCIM